MGCFNKFACIYRRCYVKVRAIQPLRCVWIFELRIELSSALSREIEDIPDRDQLVDAALFDVGRELKGFAAKTEQAILAGIAVAGNIGHRMLWADADQYAQSIRAHLAECKSIEALEVAGSYRRGKDTIGDLDFLAVSANVTEVMDRSDSRSCWRVAP